MFSVAVCDCKTIQNTISVFTTMESYHRTFLVAVNDCCSDHVRIAWVSTHQGNIPDVKIDIFQIPSLGNNNGIAIFGIVDSGLDVIEIGWAIVVDVDYSFCEGWGCRQQDEYHYKRCNYAICSHTHFVLLEKTFSKR